MTEFNVDNKELRALANLYKTFAPKQARWSVAHILNQEAIETRKAAIWILPQKMEIRDKRFMKRQLHWGRANGRLPIEQQESYMASMTANQFTGWKEQQYGSKPDNRNRAGINARTGHSKKKKVAGRRRLKKGVTMGIGDFSGASGEKNPAHVMVNMIRRRKLFNVPFVISKKIATPTFKRGVYVLRKGGKKGRGKIEYIQTPDVPNQTKRLPWMDIAVFRMFKRLDIKELWIKTFNYQMEARYRKRK